MNTLIATVAAYLIGSISFAVVMSRVFGLSDPRTIATLIGDGAKGWLAVFLAVKFGPQYGLDDAGIALVSIAVFLGHLWPVFFRFVGGKGVATALGVLLGLNGWLGLATLVTWLVVAYAFRYSSLAALIAAIFAPFYYGLLFGVDEILFAVIAMSALLLWRHSGNIANLIAGKESRIGSKAAGAKKK
jgi:glycerol-3-phosphate acyltransferase PlsY